VFPLLLVIFLGRQIQFLDGKKQYRLMLLLYTDSNLQIIKMQILE
jgi:hypothetical protein